MVGYNTGKAQREALRHCRDAVPVVPVSVARQLKKRVAGFYPTSPAKKITHRVKRDVLGPLEEDGFVLRYTPASPVWDKARALVSRYKRKGEPLPRGVGELYQANFLYLEETDFPLIKSLPRPSDELNLDLVVLLSRFKKTRTFTWDMLNLLLCASEKEGGDRLRLFLYRLPIDYNQIEILERVLEYGQEYSGMRFPFKPDMDNAMAFLTQLVETDKR